MASKTITGGRAYVTINGLDGKDHIMGVFDSCTVNESLSTEDIYTLGKFNAQEIAVTAYNVVTVNCSGFRVYGSGFKTLGAFPKLSDLLNLGTITITVTDRQNPAVGVAVIHDCVPETNNVNFNARASSKSNITYKGIYSTDESLTQDGDTGGVTFP